VPGDSFIATPGMKGNGQPCMRIVQSGFEKEDLVAVA
jgi:hypothetical protein